VAKQVAFRNQIVKYVTKSEAPSWIANSNLWVSLHHTAPVWSDNQTQYEISYPGYARQPIARSAAGWTYNTATGTASNASEIEFPNPSGGSAEEVWWVGIGTDETGDGQLLYYTNVFEEVFLIAVNQPLIIPVGGLLVRET
jgi:hypothetical protein